ncbi:glycosylphosphatidylinositol anchor attachment 1 protein-like [Macrosteles quadrilineatus]|uniref:glycosylphosphatidylinositol anchor attachment 1 protein-like n=1 Tax=Macrosteles quadrilineatus TaxID=74068 RepID=UPI0023E21F63|nr:glycosylphosphatidylinositol anchor attachment 1 protein-like [Macrosteles quadrilineatus]
MGLLTDPTGHGRPTQFVVKYHNFLCVILYLSSIIWFCMLANNNFNAATYFSENALLPGLVKGEFDLDGEAKVMQEELEAEAQRYPESLPVPWLVAKMTRLSLDTYTHNFTLHYPLSNGLKFTGKNVYGILRAPRSASTEAIVLTVPYRPPSSAHLPTAPGLALMLALAQFFRRQKYWAKDIIFLVTEHEQLGIQAWLEAYHDTPSTGVLEHGSLLGRGGAIQAALNLELHASRVGYIDVKLSGLNGQLPNLDLVNLVHRMCSKEGVRHTFYNKEKNTDRDPVRAWMSSLGTLSSMVLTQATSVPDGNHGLFHRFGIEAVTLEGFEKTGKGSPATMYQLGRVLEGLLRSLNNLLERFHQSFFFYLLPDTDRYVSIGVYQPCVVTLAAALFLKAFTFWLLLKKPPTSSSETPAPVLFVPADEGTYKKLNIVYVGAAVLVTHTVGVTLLSSGPWFTAVLNSLATEDALFYGFLGVALLTVLLPPIINVFIGKERNLILLNIMALLELATLLVAVSLTNFSLALITGLLYLPPTLWVNYSSIRYSQYSIYRHIQSNLILLNIVALLELATLLVAVSLTNFSLALITGLLYLPPTLWVNYSSIRTTIPSTYIVGQLLQHQV